MSLYKRLAAAAFLAVAAVPAIANAGVDLISNGGFESPTLGAGNYDYVGGTLNSWTYSGSAILINAANPNPGGSAWYPSAPAPTGFGGVQFAGVQQQGSLSQTFNVTSSGALDLTWLSGGRPASYGCCNGDQSYQVLVGGVVEGTYSTTSGQAFTPVSLTLLGLGLGAHTLTFQGRSPNDETAFIDNVSLSAAAVPEPAAWALMLVGFGGMGAAIRGRRTATAANA